MKVAYLNLKHRGGMVHYALSLINSISKKPEIDSILITGMIDDEIEEVKIYKFKLKFNEIYYTLSNIIKILNQYNPDIIHITSSHYIVYILLHIIKKHPIIITLHDVIPHTGERNIIMDLIQHKMIKTSKHIFVHGDILKSQLINKKCPAEKITIIPHGDYSFFSAYSEPDIKEENIILFFGRILEYKGLEYLIESEPLITSQFPNIKIIIAGTGDFSKYEKLGADKKNIEVINEFIPDNEVAQLFQKCKLVVLPYIEASQSGIIPIAYAFKKPVVATCVGSIPEIVEDGVTGFLVPPRDSEALADAIIKILKDDELRKLMGENAYIKMKDELSWDKIAGMTINVYENVIGDCK